MAPALGVVIPQAVENASEGHQKLSPSPSFLAENALVAVELVVGDSSLEKTNTRTKASLARQVGQALQCALSSLITERG